MLTPTTLLELDNLEVTSIIRLNQPEPSYWVILISCTKLLLAVASKRKSGVPSSSALCPSTSSAKEKCLCISCSICGTPSLPWTTRWILIEGNC
ncbi:hypothetical protein BT93_B2387 [Corymbia citriodora subsp. variegata]|nr:hypothetical protein BT93_B2387 [Corymbia citriodora subsp. variegata]